MSELWELSAARLSELLAAREVSSVEVVESHLNRIASVDPHLRAFTHLFGARAIDEAQRADDARLRGQACGPLHGLPVTVKESFDMIGLRTTLGVASRDAHVATSDAV